MVGPSVPSGDAAKSEVFVDGKRLETLSLGPTSRGLPTIVMLHEGLGSVGHWRDFPYRVAEATGFGVFVYSRYGYGDSDPLQEKRTVEYMHHEAEVVLPLLLSQMGIACPLLFGHSDGATIALIYAGKYPGSQLGLILEAPHVFVEDVSIQSVSETGALYRTTDLPSRLGRYHRQVDAMFWGWNDIWLDPRFRSLNIESSLNSITCPVLVLQGTEDEYGTVRQVEAIRNRIPSAQTLLLEKCGHSPHREQPDVILSHIVQFAAPFR